MAATVKNLDYFYPFDSVNDDRQVTAATERRFYSTMYTNGIVGTGFELTRIGERFYHMTTGVAMIGGTVGGLTSDSDFFVNTGGYIVLRLDTTQSARNISLMTAVNVLEDDSQAQLDAGGKFDLPLYKITYLTGQPPKIEDMRAYATSFDETDYQARFSGLLDGIEDDAGERLSALESTYQTAIDAANADNAGTYGAAGRQGFLNPDFSVNQRGGASYSLTEGSAYTFDRWRLDIEGRAHSSAVVVGRETDGARNALTIATSEYATASGAAASSIVQCIEHGVRTFCNGGRSFTVSFDAKAATAAKIAVECTQHPTGAAGTAIAAQSVDVGTTWQRHSLTFVGTASADIDAGDVLKVAFVFAWAGNFSRFGSDQDAANSFEIANVQLNEGTTALAPYIPTYADSLEACRRYYVKLGATTLSCGPLVTTTKQATTAPIPLTRAMRVTPTVTTWDTANVRGAASALRASGTNANGLAVAISPNVSGGGAPCLVVTNTGTGELACAKFSKMELDAEVYV